MSDVVQKLWGFCHTPRHDGIDYGDYVEQNLAKAFRGELVPTEAKLARWEGRDIEPASVLLERIRREREAAPKSGQWNKRRLRRRRTARRQI